MWIRNQERNNLVNCNEIEVVETCIYNKDFRLGEYKSNERALDVLDDIQCYIAKD